MTTVPVTTVPVMKVQTASAPNIMSIRAALFAPVLALTLGISAFTPVWAAEADTGLPAELLGEPAAPTTGGKAATGDGNQIVTRSQVGAWILRSDAAKPGLNCAIRFVPGRGTTQFAIFGPTEKSRSSTILFAGPDVPWSTDVEDVQVELQLRGLPATPLKAKQLPRQTDMKGGMLAVGVGDLGQLLQSMRDQERGMELHVRQTPVFHLDYDGLAAARSAMLDCVAGRRFAGKSLDEGLAEIRPLGTSTITGQAFYKGAVLASKQYPPKGSKAVGLIWMTDEFKRWHEQVKRDKKIPGMIPERIAKHFMSTVITDDKGGFTFTRLPAGEYMLIANFSYEKDVTRSELVGQTHTFAGNQHIGTQDHMAYWTETVKEPTTFEKTVFIKNDGDTLNVSLDKSLLFCFLVCF